MPNTNELGKKHFGSLLKLEERRSRTLMMIGLIASITWASNFWRRMGIFNDPGTLWIVLGILLCFFVGELLLYLRIRARLKREDNFQDFRSYYLYMVTTLEISIPSLAILLVSYSENSNFFLNSPAFMLYFMFIILSALHLNLRLSLYAGVLAGLQYVGVGFALQYLLDLPEYTVLEKFFLSERGILLGLGGLCSGFVGGETRKYLVHSVLNLEERNRVQRLLGQQVSHMVARALMHEEGLGQELSVTVMFMDVRNFTPFAEQHSPKEVVAFQNALFGPMIEVINRHQGIVNQLLGDGLMATFGAPLKNEQHAQDAVEAAQEMLGALNRLIQENVLPPIRIGIGLNSGPVIAGNIGNQIRKQYSLTGSTVILAARIEQLNKQFDTSLLISQQVYQQLTQYQDEFLPLGAVELKGRQDTVKIFKWQKDMSGPEKESS